MRAYDGIDLDGLLKVFNALVDVFNGALVPMEAAFQVLLVGFSVFGAAFRYRAGVRTG